MEYTAEQLSFFDHDPSIHGRILAGPGTGKSSTLIGYIDKVRQQYPNKKPRLLTFTRAANGELTDKVLKAGHDKVLSSTAHSFAISILLSNPGMSSFSEPLRIADDWEWNELIKSDLSRRLRLGLSDVEKLKNEMSAFWESLAPEEDANISAEIRSRFMGLWEEHRRVYGYTLLAELPFRLKEALESEPDLNIGELNLLAVDEYQDLNACDLRCLRFLSERGVTLLAVGDDDQSIYRFRKAHPAGIRNFLDEYGANDYPLTISHRCGTKILEWANYVVGGDTTRSADKPLLRAGDHNPEGAVAYLLFNRENTEAEEIVKLVKWLNSKQSIPLEEILVLARTGKIVKPIKEEFKKENIPFRDPEDFLCRLRQDNARELLSILHLLTNKNDSLAWWALLHLTRGVGSSAIGKIYDLALRDKIQFGDALIKESENDFQNISTGKKLVHDKARKVLHLIGALEIPEQGPWGSWIIERIEEGELPKVDNELIEVFKKIDSWKEDVSDLSLGQYVNQIEPMIKDIMNAKQEDFLRIMTLGRSKGLTVRAVIIAGVEDEVIPHPIGEIQEERRLLYVGMTRAREHLYITRARRRVGPTARSGRANVGQARRPCRFLEGGPVFQTDGETFIDSLK
jgi:DNA helicase II / ATP-dependent DNA helicase PcrA